MAKKVKIISEMDSAEIRTQLTDMEAQVFRLKFQMSMGQTAGLKNIRNMKKDRARMLTALRQRELEGAGK